MTDSQSPQSNKNKFWNRIQLLMIVVVFTAPVIAAFLYKPTSFNNYGDLYVPARPVSNLMMQSPEGDVEMDSMRRQWVFLVTADGKCDQVCEENILKMRQLRFMQNNDMSRIRTVFLHTDLEIAKAEDLRAKYRPIEDYSVKRDDFVKWSEQLKIEGAPPAAQKQRLYIIDPAGNLMMSYPANAEPSLMKKDIKRLLKTSQIG